MISSFTTGELEIQLSIFPSRLSAFIFFPGNAFSELNQEQMFFPSVGVSVPPINLQRESQLYSETKQGWNRKHKGIKPLSCSSL